MKALLLLTLAAALTIPVSGSGATKRPLLEEETGTWCGNCPRGWKGMKLMKENYPEFIGVSYHCGYDPMAFTNDQLPMQNNGQPTCVIDRGATVMDPLFGTTDNYDDDWGIRVNYADSCKKPGFCDIDLETRWMGDSAKLYVKAYVVFDTVAPGDSYKIGYLLIKNGICRPDQQEYDQHNYYAGQTDVGSKTDPLYEVACMPEIIPGFVHNDVVVNLDYARGVDRSLPTTITLGKTYTHTRMFATDFIPSRVDEDDNLLQDRSLMEVVAFVIDSKGRIVNARKVDAGQATRESAIESTLADQAGETVYYDLQGRRVANPQNGLYIKVTGDKAVKVIL